MPVQCVRCTFPLREPLAEFCPHCGTPVSASLPRQVESHPAATPAETTTRAASPPPPMSPTTQPAPLPSRVAPHEAQLYTSVRSRSLPSGGTRYETNRPVSPSPPARSRRVGGLIGAGLVLLVIVSGFGADMLYATLNTRGQVRPHPSPTATKGPLYDSLLVREASWPSIPTKCFFGSGGYHVANNSICRAPLPAFGDGSVRVDLTVRPGTGVQEVAVLFRETDIGTEYGFFLDTTGKWGITKTLESQLTVLRPLMPSAAIHTGPNANNTLLIQLAGSHFVFFANGTQLGTMDDTSLPRGGLAFATIPGVEAIFSNLQVDPVD